MFALWRLWRRIGGPRALIAQGLLAWRLFKDGRVPLTAKLVVPAALLYYFSPLNIIFQWVPFFGQVDDLAIALIALGAFLKLSPKHLVYEHARRLEHEFADQTRRDRMSTLGRFARPAFGKYTKEAPEGYRPELPATPITDSRSSDQPIDRKAA